MKFKNLFALALLVAFFLPAYASALERGYNHKTYVFFDRNHGLQVEYYAANGLSYLWYPGNRRAVIGRWQVTNQNQMCFKYGSNTYNPVTDEQGGNWECQPMEIFRRNMVLSCASDEFNLSSGRIPYKLTTQAREIV